MKKGGLFLGIFSLISLIGLVNAQSVLTDIFSGIGGIFVPAVLFVIFFVVLFYSTSKIFKGNKAISAVISLAVSLLIIYWINQSVDLGNLLSGFGISGDNLYTIGTIIFLAFIIFLFVKIKSAALFVIGGLFIAAAISGLVYATGTVLAIGIILVIIGFIFAVKKKRGGIPQGIGGNSIFNTTHNYNTTNQYKIKVRHEREASQNRESGREQEVIILENKAAHDQKAAVEEEKRDEQQQRQLIAQERGEEKQIEQKETSLISTDIKSLMNSYNALYQTFNELQGKNDPNNRPKLEELQGDMIHVRDEMIRLKREQQKGGN